MSEQKILIVAHGHPDHSKGGAEVAAYNLFKEYERRGMDTLFLARSSEPSHGGSVFSSRNGGREILFHTAMHDWFNFRCAESKHIWHDFRELLKRYQPTVVHFHHYAHMGMEMIREVKNTLPKAKIIFTLHEYLALCFNNGQMVKPGGTKLCYGGSPVDCAKCFQDKSAADFFLREQYFKSLFELVDMFVSPSHFLIDRYKAWGLPEEKMVMIENGQPEAESDEPRPLAEGEKRSRFAYFGQITPFKGLDVLLEALLLLPEDIREEVHLDIHGANLELQPGEYRDKVVKLIEELEHTVTMHGSYESHEIGKLMHETDWMVIPSVWWENSPIVIQEAFNHGRPIICSDIGGMAEKIEDGVTGLHFRRGKANVLAKKIEQAVQDSKLWDSLRSNIVQPLTIQDCADSHLVFCKG